MERSGLRVRLPDPDRRGAVSGAGAVVDGVVGCPEMQDPSFAEHLVQLQEDEVSLPFALRCVDDLVGQLLARHLRV